MRDLFQELEDYTGEFPPAWKPEPGDVLVGKVVRYDRGFTVYGEVRTVTIERDNGERVAVWLSSTVLLNEFAKQKPKPGERVGERLLAYAGARAGDVRRRSFAELLEAPRGRPAAGGGVALAAARRWLRRQRLDDAGWRRWCSRATTAASASAPAPVAAACAASAPADPLGPPPGRAECAAAPARRQTCSRRCAACRRPSGARLQALYGIGGAPRRGRRSRELLALAERAVARLREALPAEHFAANLF
jgi:hypothetical protein